MTGVEDDRPGIVFRQSPFNLPDDALAFFLVGFRRLLIDQPVDLGAAVAGVVALRRADIVFVELLAGVVDCGLADIEADREVLGA